MAGRYRTGGLVLGLLIILYGLVLSSPDSDSLAAPGDSTSAGVDADYLDYLPIVFSPVDESSATATATPTKGTPTPTATTNGTPTATSTTPGKPPPKTKTTTPTTTATPTKTQTPTATATSTATPTATATATATGTATNTPVPPPPVKNGDFEQGILDWLWNSLKALTNLITNSQPVTPHSGSWLGWLGRVADEISQLWQSVSVPNNVDSFYLWFWIWIDSADTDCENANSDRIIFKADGDEIFGLPLCDETHSGNWFEMGIPIDLSAYAGETIDILFEVTIDGDSNVSTVYIDDVRFDTTSPPVIQLR